MGGNAQWNETTNRWERPDGSYLDGNRQWVLPRSAEDRVRQMRAALQQGVATHTRPASVPPARVQPSRTAKWIIVTLAVVLLVMVGALVSAMNDSSSTTTKSGGTSTATNSGGTSNAATMIDPVDDFLRVARPLMPRTATRPFTDNIRIELAVEGVCDPLDRNWGYYGVEDIVYMWTTGSPTPMTASQARKFVNAAVQAFCPEYRPA